MLMWINTVAKTCVCPLFPSSLGIMRSDYTRDYTRLVNVDFYIFLDYYTRDSTSDIPFFFLKYGKITVFLVNLFEATISHLISLIVNELNLATVYYIWKWETRWTVNTLLHIFDTNIVHSIPATIKVIPPSTNWGVSSDIYTSAGIKGFRDLCTHSYIFLTLSLFH